jgi:Protein UNC80
MQGAEKCPTEFAQYMQNDLTRSAIEFMTSTILDQLFYSHEPIRRRKSIHRIGTLLGRRLQILSQTVILDRSYRRPFKSTRHPISFVPTDIGSSQYVREEHPDDITDKSGKTLPLELRKRLLEIGWGYDDKPTDERLELAMTPMSLLPSTELSKVGGEDVDSLAAGAFHAIFEQQKSVLEDSSSRRKSIGDTTAKRRPVFVIPLVSLFPRLASHVFDTDSSTASAARNLLLDLMRDDPSILFRTVFNTITGNETELTHAISTLRALLHVRQALPPATAHHVFTHLTGYLKFTARQVETVEALHGFAYTAPILAKLVSQVSNMSIRDIRRAKIEVFVIPTLSLWFPPSAPTGPMFPRSIGESRQKSTFEIPTNLTWITIIRTSQYMLFYSMLKKNPQDVHIIRKNLTKFVLPLDNPDDQDLLDLVDFVPQDPPIRKFSGGQTVYALSLILSRSYLLLVAQIFRSMSRHTNDRNDLAILVDGINRILIAHGSDTGIVGQAMIGECCCVPYQRLLIHASVALMAASTRFRRLFTSAGGYTLFMPAVFKVYAEAGEGSAVRLAVEYAINRFYALHQEAFVFQTLDVISLVILTPDASDITRVTRALYSLLSTLKSAIPATAPDPAGIHNANKGQEREAIIVSTVEEKSQTLFDHIRKVGRNEIAVDVPDEYEGKRFALDDIVRIFLTVVAHDPSVARAEHFLHVLRYLTPDLYNASNSARAVLTGGVVALGAIFLTKAGGKTKIYETTQNRPGSDMKFESFGPDQPTTKDRFLVNSNLPVDILTMRMEYLSLVLAFTRSGGLLNDSSMLRVIDLVKTILKDSKPPWSQISSFLSEYTKTTLIRSPALSAKQVVAFLNELGPVFLTYYAELSFSEIITTVSLLACNPLYANDAKFARTVVKNYCNTGLAVCELAASESFLFSSPMRSAVVDLMCSCVPLRGIDLVSQLEQRRISYEFIAGIVFPFALALKPVAQAMAEVEHNVLPDTYARTWIRLLAYVISACRPSNARKDANPVTSPIAGERKSIDKRGSATELVPISTLAICLQIIKVIVVKAGDDMSSLLPDVWSRISAFLNRVLADGDASFVMYPVEVSQPPSPFQSPRTSVSGGPDVRFQFPITKRTFRPRIVDYLLWSLFELLCLHRTSLLLQMRLTMQEKVRLLEEQLQLDRSAAPTTPSMRYSRRVSSMFSKRGRSSINHSSTSSPENSPNLRPSVFSPSEAVSVHSTPTKTGREAGYLRTSPSGRSSPSVPRIVHLGPVRHPSFLRDFESREKSSLLLLNSTVVKSAVLIRATFRRIRLVQSFLGYSMLLSYPDGGDPEYTNDEDVTDVSGWTKAEALQSILDETKQLVDEFSRKDDDLEFEGGDYMDPGPNQSVALLIPNSRTPI